MAKRKAAGSTIDMSDRNYETLKVVDGDGKVRASKGNGDAVQKAMLVYAADGGDWMKVVRANGLKDKYPTDAAANVGLFRMRLGNSLRALVKAGAPAVIGDITVKSLDQNVKLPEPKAEKKATRKKAA